MTYKHFSCLLVRHQSLSMPRQTLLECAKVVVQIREENNCMFTRWARYALLSLSSKIAKDNNRVLFSYELNAFHHNSTYQFDFSMSDKDDS